MQQRRLNTPMLASFFMPGLGQLLQGRIVAALVWLLFLLFALLSVQIGVGLIFVPAVWLFAIIDAVRFRPPYQQTGALEA